MAKILVIDDEEIIRKRLKSLLELDGYETFTAGDGQEGLKVFRKENPEIALVDIKMPGMDGIEVLRKIKEERGKTEVIIITGHGGVETAIQAMKDGAFGYVQKPIEYDELEIEIRKAMEKQEMQRKLDEYVHDLEAANRQLTRYANEMEKLAEERAEQLVHAERMATLGIMAAGIAHEINNPTMFISANLRSFEKNWPAIKESLDYARQKIGDDEADFVLEDMPKVSAGIKKGIERTKKIIDSLRIYSHQEKGERKLVNVEECIDQSLEICHNRIKHNVTIERPQPNPSLQAKCDPQRIEQVIVNLLVNATDAIEEHKGKGVIEITTEKGADSIRIKLADNGPGIPEGKVNDLFKPFYTTKEVDKGTGLGLAICQNIAEDHGGSLTVKNRPQGGAEFTLALPLCRDTL